MEEKIDKLLQMQEIMQADISNLKDDVSTLKSDVSTLKGDVSTLKSDVSTLKSDVSILKGDVSTLKGDVNNLRGSIAFIEIDHGRKLQVLLERDVDYAKRHDEYMANFAQINQTLQEYDARLYNLENPA